jgi:hypothetical protein
MTLTLHQDCRDGVSRRTTPHTTSNTPSTGRSLMTDKPVDGDNMQGRWRWTVTTAPRVLANFPRLIKSSSPRPSIPRTSSTATTATTKTTRPFTTTQSATTTKNHSDSDPPPTSMETPSTSKLARPKFTPKRPLSVVSGNDLTTPSIFNNTVKKYKAVLSSESRVRSVKAARGAKGNMRYYMA